MKKVFFIIILFCSLGSLNAQNGYKEKQIWNYQKVDQKWLHFGFTLATNSMDFAISNNVIRSVGVEQVEFVTGFSVGIVSDMRLNQNFNLRFLPGLEFGERKITYTNLGGDDDLGTVISTETVYVTFPVLLKYRAKRINNYRPYIVGGASFKTDVQTRTVLKPEENILIRLNPNAAYLELGAGIDFYLPYFKLSTEIKFSIGMLDALNHELDLENPGYEDYTNSISRMRSKVITLSFHFE